MDINKLPFRHSIYLASGGAATENLDDDLVKTGWRWEVTRISVENETSSYDQLRIGVVSRGLFYPEEEQKGPLAEYLYWAGEEFVLTEGERIRIELKGTTSEDVIKAYIEGFWYRIC